MNNPWALDPNDPLGNRYQEPFVGWEHAPQADAPQTVPPPVPAKVSWQDAPVTHGQQPGTAPAARIQPQTSNYNIPQQSFVAGLGIIFPESSQQTTSIVEPQPNRPYPTPLQQYSANPDPQQTPRPSHYQPTQTVTQPPSLPQTYIARPSSQTPLYPNPRNTSTTSLAQAPAQPHRHYPLAPGQPQNVSVQQPRPMPDTSYRPAPAPNHYQQRRPDQTPTIAPGTAILHSSGFAPVPQYGPTASGSSGPVASAASTPKPGLFSKRIPSFPQLFRSSHSNTLEQQSAAAAQANAGQGSTISGLYHAQPYGSTSSIVQPDQTPRPPQFRNAYEKASYEERLWAESTGNLMRYFLTDPTFKIPSNLRPLTDGEFLAVLLVQNLTGGCITGQVLFNYYMYGQLLTENVYPSPPTFFIAVDTQNNRTLGPYDAAHAAMRQREATKHDFKEERVMQRDRRLYSYPYGRYRYSGVLTPQDVNPHITIARKAISSNQAPASATAFFSIVRSYSLINGFDTHPCSTSRQTPGLNMLRVPRIHWLVRTLLNAGNRKALERLVDSTNFPFAQEGVLWLERGLSMPGGRQVKLEAEDARTWTEILQLKGNPDQMRRTLKGERAIKSVCDALYANNIFLHCVVGEHAEYYSGTKQGTTPPGAQAIWKICVRSKDEQQALMVFATFENSSQSHELGKIYSTRVATPEDPEGSEEVFFSLCTDLPAHYHENPSMADYPLYLNPEYIDYNGPLPYATGWWLASRSNYYHHKLLKAP